MNNTLKNALEETWKNKEKFYEDTKHLNIMEIIEKIEGRKFNVEFIQKERPTEEQQQARNICHFV